MPYSQIAYSQLTLGFEGSTAIVTLNRPEQRNALSLALMREMIACLSELERHADARCIILAAAGPAFCSGHDLREMTGLGAEACEELFCVCTEMMTKIQSVPQPVIAEVQGIATAAGCQLVAACDLAVASSQATFATPGVKIGLFCTTPMVALTRANRMRTARNEDRMPARITPVTSSSGGMTRNVMHASGQFKRSSATPIAAATEPPCSRT